MFMDKSKEGQSVYFLFEDFLQGKEMSLNELFVVGVWIHGYVRSQDGQHSASQALTAAAQVASCCRLECSVGANFVS